MKLSEVSLFGEIEEADYCDDARNPALSQWYTPAWVAQFLVERYFSTLTTKDLVIEPSCGLGAFMKAIPDDVPVVGVEIDPRLAEQARENTGRTVITENFAQVDLPSDVTAIIGNPPFPLSIVEAFLGRAYKVLPNAGRIGLLLPTYHFQTFGRVDRWMQSWGLHVDMIPRGIFPGIRLPLAYCLFAKNARHEPHGLALYAEAAAIANLSKTAQEVLTNTHQHPHNCACGVCRLPCSVAGGRRRRSCCRRPVGRCNRHRLVLYLQQVFTRER